MLTTISHPAMATEFSVLLPAENAHLADAALEALEMLDQIEADLSIYHEGSEICLVNSGAFDGPVCVSRATYDLLERAKCWSQQTEGAFDVTAGPLVRAWGFTLRRGQKPTAEAIRSALDSVGYQKMNLEPSQCAVRFTHEKMEINLGAIGKGYALDRLAETLLAAGAEHFLIHGGSSSILARGDQEVGSGQGWAVGIAHPTKPKKRLAGLRLKDQALSTSGSGKQFFHHRGRRYGHVIDPRTGYPAGDLLSLTAICDSATDAEAASTGFFVWGRDEITQMVEESTDAPGMIGVVAAGRQDDMQTIAWSKIDWIDPPANVKDEI